MLKHTPGPWKVKNLGHHYGTFVISPWDKIERRWFLGDDSVDHVGERFANAALIAAAPDLLNAAIEALDKLVIPANIQSKLVRAVAKARGES